MTGGSVITGRTKIVGVWGHPVSHSRSPAMQNAALAALGLDWVYVPFEVSLDAVPSAINGLRVLGLVGINVTVPLKEAVLPFLDVIDAEAARTGSVNTIHNRDGVLYGYSTDGAGFMRALEAHGEPASGRHVYLCGAGGSARAVGFALAAAGNHITIVNRTAERASVLSESLNQSYPGSAEVAAWGQNASEFDLIVNTTSLGMTPNIETMPDLPLQSLHAGQCVYDLVYAPSETLLLKTARAAGCRTLNGISMLVFQGALSLSTWTDLPLTAIPTDVMEQAVRAALER